MWVTPRRSTRLETFPVGGAGLGFPNPNNGRGPVHAAGKTICLRRNQPLLQKKGQGLIPLGFVAGPAAAVWFGLVLKAHGVGQLSSGKLSRPKDNSMQTGLSPGLHTEDTDPTRSRMPTVSLSRWPEGGLKGL